MLVSLAEIIGIANFGKIDTLLVQGSQYIDYIAGSYSMGLVQSINKVALNEYLK